MQHNLFLVIAKCKCSYLQGMTVGHTVCSFRIRRVEIYLCVAVAHMKHCEYKCIRESVGVGVCVWVCGRVS